MEMYIIPSVIIVVILLTIIGLLSRYRKCASDEILVVYGKAGKKTITGPDGKKTTIALPSKILHGGGTFVMPVIQAYKTMSLRPIQLQQSVSGLSNQNIKVTIPVTLTTAIGTSDALMQNAASRFLSAGRNDMADQIKDILIGETRGLMATMTIEDINADRVKFLDKAQKNIETQLNKIGFEIININTADISDDADYIKNLGKKAATQAKAQAEADIAEQQKIGDVKIANTKKEKEIAVAEAEKERETQVAETKQIQAVKVAEINKNKEISLAEAEKNKASGIAAQEAEKRAQVAKAKAEAEKAEAAAEAEAEASVAKSIAESESQQQEAESQKQIRIANAIQKQEAETIQATQEKEARAAEYESHKKQRKAEADKQAGVAEQEAKIAVAEATAKAGKAQAEQVKTVETAKVDAQMSVEQTKQERQLKVNEAEAKAAEAKLHATTIVPAEKAKEKTIIEAEALKEKAILEAEAEKQKILKEAEAEAEKIRLTKEAEAEGTKKIMLAEAEGKRASLMAEADKEIAIGLIPAQVVERMKAVGMTPEMIVQYKTVDKLEGIARAQAEAYEHIHLGEVTVYGNENTAGNFMASIAESVMPMIKTAAPVKDAVAKLFSNISKEEPKQIAE